MDATLFATKLLTSATLLGNFTLVVFVVLLILRCPCIARVREYLGRTAMLWAFIIATTATLGSLAFSIIAGYQACILCWIQRLFMFPEPLLLGYGLWARRIVMLRVAFGVALLGASVALYNWIKDMLAMYSGVTVPCPAVSFLPSCDRIYVNEYGYITIAMMSLNAFLWIMLITWIGMRAHRQDTEATT